MRFKIEDLSIHISKKPLAGIHVAEIFHNQHGYGDELCANKVLQTSGNSG
jgi:hypothetical protein